MTGQKNNSYGSGTTLRQIIDSAPMSMAIVSMDGTIEYINRKAVETFGYAHADIPNMDRWWVQAYPNEHYRKEVTDRWMGRVQEAFLRKSEIDGGEYKVTCKDGTLKTVFIFGVIAAGRVFVMFEDVTKRAAAEKSLWESESLYRALVETTGTGYVVVNAQGNVLDANREYVRLSGHKDLKEILGRNIVEWTAPHEKGKNAKAMAQCARDGHIWNLEIDYINSAGKITPIEINSTVVTRGGAMQLLTLCRDITVRRRHQEEIRSLTEGLEKRVRERTAELTAANLQLSAQIAQRTEAEKSRNDLTLELLQSQKMEAIGRLAGGIAHDFNNILVSISGCAELLIKTLPKDSPMRSDLAEIRTETKRGAALTRQLTAMSRREPVQKQVLDLNSIISDTGRMLKRIIGANMHLETLLSPDIARIRSDPGQVSQIIMNLVVNSRDAMPDGGKIILRTANEVVEDARAGMRLAPAPGNYVTLSVTDTGSGILPGNLEHIFEPFFTTKEEGKGSGLGLPTVYGIVLQAKGGIGVETEPGRGTTFKIYFPRAA